MNEMQVKKIDEIFKLWLDNPGAGGQLVIHYKGEVFERCYGYQDIESQTPMTQESVFHLASMSKQVTAMCIYMLYERGKLDFTDDIKKYVPDLIQIPQTITINDLLHQTSGLPDHYNFLFHTGRSVSDTITQPEILRMISKIRELNFEPGTHYGYSNPNYVLLATIVERISGQTLNDFCQENIFKPLGMTHTFVRDDPQMLIPNRVHSYNDDGYRYTNSILNLCMYGSTTLHSTARDMAIYLRQYINPTLIRRETMEQLYLFVPDVPRGKTLRSIYASGVFVEEMFGHKYIHHGGINAGFRHFGVCFPDDDLIIIRLANTYNIPYESSTLDVARVVLDLPPRTKVDISPFKTDSVDLSSIPGFYYCDKNRQNYNVEVRDGVVYSDNIPLKPIGGNLFQQGHLDVFFAFGEELVVKEYDSILHLRKVTEQLTPEQASQYTGKYICKPFESHWQILWEEEKLWLYHLRFGKLQLRKIGEDTFSYALGTYTFARDEQGKVIGFNRGTARQKYMFYTKED